MPMDGSPAFVLGLPMPTRADRLAVFEVLLEATPELPRKGKANPYTSMNGNMVAVLGKGDELALRLSKARRAEKR